MAELFKRQVACAATALCNSTRKRRGAMMDMVSTVAPALMGGVFVWSGVEHFMKFRPLTQFLALRIIAPAFLLAIASALEIVAGLCLAAGVARPYAALFLIIFTIAASVLMLDFWRHAGSERDSLRSAFLINIAVIGGLLLAAMH